MVLKVLGSSSKGNCYLLDNGKEALMIESGVSFAKVKQALDFDIKRIVGCIISHEHGDHAKHVKDCINANIPVFMSQGTRNALGLDYTRLANVMDKVNFTHLGGFEVIPFQVEHDAAEPWGFQIYHPDCGNVFFATDTRIFGRDTDFGSEFYVPEDVNQLMIECNYQTSILEHNVEIGKLHPSLARRTRKTHCSLDTVLASLAQWDLSQCRNIVLLHLSETNSDADMCKEEVIGATAKKVTIAEPGVNINFNKNLLYFTNNETLQITLCR
jgi:phosphoribosyl 1,2-cyclic phosphodiesterase